MSLSQATTAYDVIRLELLEKESKTFIMKFNDFVDKVKLAVISSNGSNNMAEEAMQQALSFFSQDMPQLSDDEEPVGGEKRLSLKKLHEDMEQMRRDIEHLKKERDELDLNVTCLMNVAKDEKQKLSSQTQKHDKLASQFKQHKLSQRLALHVVEKNLTKTRDFIKRSMQNLQVQQTQGATASYPRKSYPLPIKDNKTHEQENKHSSKKCRPKDAIFIDPPLCHSPRFATLDSSERWIPDPFLSLRPSRSSESQNSTSKALEKAHTPGNQKDQAASNLISATGGKSPEQNGANPDIIAGVLGAALGSSLRNWNYFLTKK